MSERNVESPNSMVDPTKEGELPLETENNQVPTFMSETCLCISECIYCSKAADKKKNQARPCLTDTCHSIRGGMECMRQIIFGLLSGLG